MLQEMEKHLEYLEAERRDTLAWLAKLPDGVIYSSKKGGKNRYYLKDKEAEKRTYIPKSDYRLVKSLALRRYLEYKVDDIEREIEATKFYIRHHRKERKADRLLAKDGAFRELLEEVSEEVNEALMSWANEPYEQEPDPQKQRIYRSLAGTFHRSKSEVLIANCLWMHHIPFRYEQVFHTLPNKYGKSYVFYPDFTILHPITGRIYIWEHLGMMDNPEYREHNAFKLKEYTRAGYTVNVNLIITTEDENHHIDTREIEKLVEKLFL